MEMSWKRMRRLLRREALLRRMGLEDRSPAGDFFTGLGLFSIGVLVGAGLGLLFAPRRGDEVRAAMTGAWRNRGRGGEELQEHLGIESSVPPMAQGH